MFNISVNLTQELKVKVGKMLEGNINHFHYHVNMSNFDIIQLCMLGSRDKGIHNLQQMHKSCYACYDYAS